MGFLFLGKSSIAYETHPNQMAVLWNTLGDFIWECQSIFTCSARTKSPIQSFAGFEPHETSSWGYFALHCNSLPSSTTWDKFKEIGLAFNFGVLESEQRWRKDG